MSKSFKLPKSTMANYKSKHAESERVGRPGDSPAEFNWKAAAGGALKGGATGSMLGPWGTVIGGLAGGISAGIKGDNKEETIKDKVNSKVDEKIEEKVDDVTTKEVEKQSGGAGYSGL